MYLKTDLGFINSSPAHYRIRRRHHRFLPMARKRDRITNPEPFLAADNGDSKSTTSTRKRPKPPKLHQQQQQVDKSRTCFVKMFVLSFCFACAFLTDCLIFLKVISSGISSKILKEALLQQKEIDDEEAREQNPNLVFPEELKKTADGGDDEEEDIDDFGGFSETRSQFGGWEEVCSYIIQKGKKSIEFLN